MLLAGHMLVFLAVHVTMCCCDTHTSSNLTAIVQEATTGNGSIQDKGNTSIVPLGSTVGPTRRVKVNDLFHFQLAWRITRYSTPVLAVIGLLGNTLSFLVMMERHNRRISCCVYMSALALSDNLHLLVALYVWAIMTFRATGFYQFECNFIDFLFPTSSFLGILYIISMTVDRMLAVRFPLRSRTWVTPRRARITIAVETSLGVINNLPNIFINETNDRGTCSVISTGGVLVSFYTWFLVCLNSVCPFILLITLNGLIISAVSNRNNMLNQMDTTKTDQSPGTKDIPVQSEKRAREQQLKVMLILVSFAVLLLTLPRYIREAVMALVDVNATPQRAADFALVNHLTARLYTTNSAINFFLYCLGGSKFRQDLVKLFRSGKADGGSQHIRIAVTNSS